MARACRHGLPRIPILPITSRMRFSLSAAAAAALFVSTFASSASAQFAVPTQSPGLFSVEHNAGLQGTLATIHMSDPMNTDDNILLLSTLANTSNIFQFIEMKEGSDIEARLDRAYEAVGGASRKYGFEPATAKEIEKMVDPSAPVPSRETRQANHRLNRI